MVGDGDSMRFFGNDDAMIRQAMPREAMPRDDSRRCDSTRLLCQAMPHDAMRRHIKRNRNADDWRLRQTIGDCGDDSRYLPCHALASEHIFLAEDGYIFDKKSEE